MTQKTSLWNTEEFLSLTEVRERETGEWLGSDAIVYEGDSWNL